MIFIERLSHITKAQNSLLCVGLDPDIERMPPFMRQESDALYRFCKEIIDSTKHTAAAFKLNFAFFEAAGHRGWHALERLMADIPNDVLTIADAKRADIGNTSSKYAEAILKKLNFDCVTVNPYMGEDSVAPFLQWPEKGAFVLGLTSNPGANDFQKLQVAKRRLLYREVAAAACKWNKKTKNVGLVVGATHAEELGSVRNIATNLPFLIPGVGAQGGNLKEAIKLGTNQEANLALINASRSIIYKSSDYNFAEAAAKEAEALQNQINQIRREKLDGFNGNYE